MSRIRADRYTNRAGTGAPTFSEGVNVVGVTSIRAGAGVSTLLVDGDLSVTNGLIKGPSNLDIAGISSSIADTAVDVFVYDTSKDSDGGAWRKRTQNTSWYNETLNTATRGSKREFPAVAVIVMEEGTLTIYDGDDPDLPMWMVFTDNNDTGNLFAGAKMLSCRTATSIFMLNGIFVCGGRGPWHDGVTEINFLTDSAKKYMNNGHYYSSLNISERESTGGYITVTSGTPSTNNNLINDLAMTVLPTAPIHDVTGLPIPTIAIASDNGISNVKDDGNIANLTRSSNEVHSITFDKDHSEIFSWGTSSGFPRHITRLSYSNWRTSSTSSVLWTNNYFSGYEEGAGASAASVAVAAGGTATVANSGRHFGIENGGGGNPDDRLVILHPRSSTNNSNINLSSFVTSSYNTGYMFGNIKGALLTSTSTDDSVASSNLASGMALAGTARLTSHTYSNGATSWQMVDNSANDNGYVQVYLNGTTPGKQYLISISIDNNPALDSGYNFNVYSMSTASQIATFTWWDGGGTGTLSAIYTSTHQGDNSNTQSDIVTFYVNGATANISNFTVREATEIDRSINNDPAVIYGTMNRVPVASNAELVAYTGWSASNYIRQPYNSALNFGTGDFSIFAWVLKNSFSTNHYICDRAKDAFSSVGRAYFIIESNGYHRFKLAGGTEVTGSTRQMTEGVYHQIGFVRRSGVMEFWMNGDKVEEVSTSDASASFDNSETGQALNIGRYANGFAVDYAFDRMSLFRISGSAPTDGQIKKMYDDEKFLFQDNAKCTFNGTSDTVTALDYDDNKEILHVGTSAGRSEFLGLRRINNTTTAVTTAISASKGLIAEQ